MKVERQRILERLKLAALGLSSRGIIEQSDCFIFVRDQIVTFNDEVMVRVKGLEGFAGAVPASELIALLEKFPDDEVSVVQDVESQQLHLTGKRRKAGIPFLNEVHLSVEDVPKPKKWVDLSPEVAGHLQSAARVCGKDETWGVTTCVHANSELIEGCDNYRLFRVETPTGFSEEIFLPGSSVYLLGGLAPTKVAVGKGWCHFRVARGVVSIRAREFESYPDLAEICRVEGSAIQLPEVLKSAVERARVTSEGIGYTTRVSVVVQEGSVVVGSRSGRGWYREKIQADYAGPKLAFSVHPDLLIQILDQSEEIVVGESRMGARVGAAQFVIALQQKSTL